LEVLGAADQSEPTYTAAFRVTTSGNYAVTATIGGVSFGILGGGAATVMISAGPISAVASSASGAGLTDAIAGEIATVYVAPRDAFGRLGWIMVNFPSYYRPLCLEVNDII